MADTLKDEKGIIETPTTPPSPLGNMTDTLKDEKEMADAPTTPPSPSALEAANDEAVDVVYVYEPPEGLSGYYQQAERYPTSCVYDYSYLGQIESYRKKKCSNNPKNLTNLIEDVFQERGNIGRATKPLIWVIEGEAATTLIELLRGFDTVFRKHGVIEAKPHWKSNLASTYGIVLLNAEHSKFWVAWLIICGQLQCLHAMDVYEKGNNSKAATPLSWLPVRLTQQPWFLALAIIGYVWAGLAAYHINRNDAYQRWCVFTGLAIGFIIFECLIGDHDTFPALLYLSGTMTTMALQMSAAGHGLWRYWFSHRTRNKRVKKALGHLERDARGMDKNTHVLKLYNVT